MTERRILKYAIVFFIGLALVILVQFFVFKDSPTFISFNNVDPTKIFNLLLALWFIAWLLESFLEILQNIFPIETNQVKRFTATLGLLIGLIIACSGVHTIGIFFSFSETPNNNRKFLFNLVDTILTAGVIAGGSKGIHELTNAYKGIMQTIKNPANTNTNNQSNLSNQPTSTNVNN